MTKIAIYLNDAHWGVKFPAALRRAAQHLGQSANPDEFSMVMNVADQIEDQATQCFTEPGLWAVVTARAVDASARCTWVHYEAGWACPCGRLSVWSLLVTPRLIRKGI